MKVLLIDFDSKIPNLALMKLSAQAKASGHTVGFDIQDPDIVYCSVVFSKNREQAAGLKTMFPHNKIIFGGPGWNLENTLPHSVEFMKPDYGLYPSEYSQGFTTRGCIRKCPFCIVPKKEGIITMWQHPRDFHDDRFKTCMIMDNNLFAAPEEWQKSVYSWFTDTGTKMKSPQGWDARLLTEERAGLLKDIKHDGNLHFAWDNMHDEQAVIKATHLLKDAGFNLKQNISFYVLVGFNTTFEQDVYRCNTLKEMGTNAFVMRYHNKSRKLNQLAKWANRRWAYWSSPFPYNGEQKC